MIWFITVKGRHQFLEQCDTTWTLVKVTTAWRSHGWWKWSKGLSLPWERLRFVCWVCHLWRSCGLQMVARAAASVTVCPSTPLLTSSCSERTQPVPVPATAVTKWQVTVTTSGANGSYYVWAVVLWGRRHNRQAGCSRRQGYPNMKLPRK